MLRCDFIPPSYGTADRDLARDLERLETRKAADRSKIDELKELIHLRVERLKFSLLLAIRDGIAPVREAFWEIHNPISRVADSFSRPVYEITYSGDVKMLDPAAAGELPIGGARLNRFPHHFG